MIAQPLFAVTATHQRSLVHRSRALALAAAVVSVGFAILGPDPAHAEDGSGSARQNLVRIEAHAAPESAKTLTAMPDKVQPSTKIDLTPANDLVVETITDSESGVAVSPLGADSSVPSSTGGTVYYEAYDRIAPADELDFWGIQFLAGEFVTIRASRLGGDLDGWISLFDPWGNEVAYDDDSAGSRNPLVRFDVRSGGQYTIRVNSFNLRTTGEYHLEIWVETVATPPSCSGTRVSIGDAATGYVGNGGSQTYCFDGRGGRWVSIRAVGIGDGLDPVLQLFDGNNNLIGYNDDAFGYELNSMVSAYLPADGTYRLVVNGYGSSSGSFRTHIGLNRKATAADANSSCSVDSGDQWLVEYFLGTTSHSDETWHADVNLDGVVNTMDYALVMTHWGNGC